MSDVAYVLVLPACDVHGSAGERVEAAYDARTRSGAWAYLCEEHYAVLGVGLGTGRGQRLVVRPRPEGTTS